EGDADLGGEAADVELAGEDTDRAGERRRRGVDARAGGGDEVAARGGQIAERADHRLDLGGALELARDHVGGEGGAAGRVDAHDDGAHARVVAGALQGGHERLHAGELHAEQRDRRRLAVDDVAFDEEHGDGGALPVVLALGRGRRGAQRDRTAEALGDGAFDLVAVAQLVDEAGGLGLDGGVGAAVDPRLGGGGVDVARGGDAVDDVGPDVADVGFALGARGLGRAGAGVLLWRALVLGYFHEVGAHAEEIAEAAEEHRRRREADQADAAGGILEDALGG